MMWSTVGDIGSGYFSDLSTGLPHIAHTDWVAIIIFLLARNREMFPACLSVRPDPLGFLAYAPGISYTPLGIFDTPLGIIKGTH